MAQTQLALTPDERRFCQRLHSKLRTLVTTEGAPAVMVQLRAAESLMDSLESYVSLRMAWTAILDYEPDSAVH